MDLGLKDRTVAVTGGSSGIGLAAVELLLDEGASVMTCGRDAGRLRDSLIGLKVDHPDRLDWMATDVRDAEQSQGFITNTIERFGRLDGLVNNAGASRTSTFATTTIQDWTDELGLKFFGIINPSRAAHPWLTKSDQAAIVNVNAVLARQPESHLVATSAARAGILNLSKSMATEFAVDRIRVNSVCVGLIDTGQWSRRYAAANVEETFDQWATAIAADRKIPLARFGTAREVAATIVFLLSARSSYTTGAALEVAGGVNHYV